MLVCPLLLLTYTFTPKTWKSYQSFQSQKSNRWFCSLLVLAGEQAYPQQSVLLYNNPLPPKPPLQHTGYTRPTSGVGEDGWEGAGPLASRRVQTHALMSEQHLRRQVDKTTLDWVENPWALGPALLTSVNFLGKNATERLQIFKCRKETVSTEADKNMLTGTQSARTQGKHFCSHRRAEIKSKLYQTDN